MSEIDLTTLLIDTSLGAALFVALYSLLRQGTEFQHSGIVRVLTLCCLTVTLVVFVEVFFLFFSNAASDLNRAIDTPPPDLQLILQQWRSVAVVLVVVGALTSLCLALRNLGDSVVRLRAENSALSASTKLSVIETEILRKRHKMETLGQFTSRIGHQFNNMLSIILTNAEMGEIKLESGSASKKYFTSIQKTVNKSRLAVQKLVAFSRVESSAKKKNLNLNKLIETMTEMMLTLLPEDIELSHHLPEEPLEICGIESQVQHLLVNVVALGIRPSENGRGNINISLAKALTVPVTAEQDCQYVVIKVLDGNSEFTPAALERAFSPTFTSETIISSAGLSLYVAQAIVRNHDGVLEASCQPGHGTQIAIYLPYFPTPEFPPPVPPL